MGKMGMLEPRPRLLRLKGLILGGPRQALVFLLGGLHASQHLQDVGQEVDKPSAGDLRELARVPLRGEGSCGGGGAPRERRVCLGVH